MWNSSIKKTALVALIAAITLCIFRIFNTWWSGIPLVVVITIAIDLLIEEINSLRKTHGLDVEDLERRINELESKIKK